MTQYYGATYTIIDDELEVTNVFPVGADWRGYEFSGYCRPTSEEVKAAGYSLLEKSDAGGCNSDR